MPWCPRCDETFPQGPACPRCSTRLVARDHEPLDDALYAMPDLQSIRVSRRNRRALERMSGPRAPSSRSLVFALVLLVFASGFLLGRVGSIGSQSPTVRALPMTEPLAFEGVRGSASYLLGSQQELVTLTRHDLYSGDVTPRGRFDAPIPVSSTWSTRVVTLDGSAAAVVSDGNGRGYVAFAGVAGPSHAWVSGADAAWDSPARLVVRGPDGTLTLWTTESGEMRSAVIGTADAIHQTSAGIVLERGRTLEGGDGSQTRTLELPPTGRVVAVAPDLSRAVLDDEGPSLWDGETLTSIRVDGATVSGASFDRSSELAAVVLRQGDRVRLAIVDGDGSAALKPLGGRASCEAVPAWDAAGRWVYIATGDGQLYAVEAGGGRIESVRTRALGCGAAWLDSP